MSKQTRTKWLNKPMSKIWEDVTPSLEKMVDEFYAKFGQDPDTVWIMMGCMYEVFLHSFHQMALYKSLEQLANEDDET